MNFVVVGLSYLAVGEKAYCPDGARVGAPLSGDQWAMVEGLRDAVKQWSPAGLRSAELACGRKGTELAELVAKVHEAALDLADPSSGAVGVPRVGLAGRQGFLPVVADRIRMPGAPANVDLAEWLAPDLWMAYVEPKALRSLPRRPVTWARPAGRRPSGEEVKLMMKWQRAGRLLLAEAGEMPRHRYSVLAAVAKSEGEDRQIIDRRGANGEEDKIVGPSVLLPSAADLCEISLEPGMKLACGGSDLAHCYHHIAVSQERAFTNPIGKPIAAAVAARAGLGDAVWAPSLPALGSGPRRGAGGRSAEAPLRRRGGPAASAAGALPVAACFDGLPMGDHGAVEFVHAAHGELLRQAGLLGDREVCGGRPLPEGGEYHLRCIDDLKVLCQVPRDLDLGASPADRGRPDRAALDAALAAYRRAGWPVAESKLVRDVSDDLVLGGELLGEVGHLGAPRQRRFVLGVLLLRAARLRWTSGPCLESLLGSLTFCLLFRRPLLAVLQTVFALAGADRRLLVPLPRSAAAELSLAAVLLPLAFSDLRAETLPAVWASDASPVGGGLCRAAVAPARARELYRVRERRGGYSQLESPVRALLRELGLCGSPGSEEEAAVFPSVANVAKPLAFSFDFLELFSVDAPVSACLARRGVTVGPPLSSSASRWFDLRGSRTLEWLVWLVSERRVRAVLLAPGPSALCALAARSEGPCAELPGQADRERGARLADFALLLLRCCRRSGVIGLDEWVCEGRLRRPRRWRTVAERAGFGWWQVEACAHGAPSRRTSFVLSTRGDLSSLARPCPGFHAHEGSLGSPLLGGASAWPPLAEAWADAIADLLRKDVREADEPAARPGYEKVGVNVLADCLDWKVERRWRWRQPAHINLLEQRALHSLVRERVRRGEAGRCVVMVDSRVVLCSGAKGRSPSFALGARWRATLPWLLGGRLYLGLLFVPTRKNPADAPSRFRPLAAAAGALPDAWRRDGGASQEAWRRWLALPPLPRPLANWAQLALRLADRFLREELLDHPPPPVRTDGEAAQPGPRPANWVPRAEPPLERRALLAPAEVEKRQRMLGEFLDFLGEIDLEDLCADPAACGAALEAFGRNVYRQVPRRPVADYARAILAVVDGHRSLRRSLTQAWDFAAVWRLEEPGANNLAMPAVVLRAFVSTALFWGWPKFAAMVALGFCGLLRPAEYLLSSRQFLVLPSDVQGAWFRCYVRVPSPKSRWAAARRQLARVDDWWVTALLTKLYRDSPPAERLWPASPAAFRRRWNAVADALGLDRRQGAGLTPASLRAGGATAHYEAWEDAERLRRRGRWQKLHTVEIYVQEIAPYEFLANLRPSARAKVFAVARYLDVLLPQFLEASRGGPSPPGGYA